MPDATSSDSTSRPAGHFETTLWTVVLQAGSAETTQSRAALEHLCRAYWHPLYCYVRRRGHPAHDAQDLVQGFFAHLLDQNPFGKVAPEKGRFRSFLLVSLNHFISDECARANAQRRGGGQPVISLDVEIADQGYRLEPADRLSADQLFEKRWALAVLEAALRALRMEQQAAGKVEEFSLLEGFLTEGADEQGYGPASAALNKPPGTIAVTVLRLRRRYRELLRAQIATTVASPAEVESEMRDLLAALRA